MTNRRGYVLLAVVAFLAMATALASVVIMNARASVREIGAQMQSAQMDASMQGAMARSLFLLGDANSSGAWGQDLQLRMPNADVDVNIQDVRGLVDINTASVEMLQKLITAVIPDDARQDPDRLAAAIVDWRDADGELSPLGAEKQAYSAAGLPPPGNRPFADIVELGRVLDFTPEIVRALLPFVTVHSGLDMPQAELAPDKILELLELPPDALAAIHDAREADVKPELDNPLPARTDDNPEDSKSNKERSLQWAHVRVRLTMSDGTRRAEALLIHVSAPGQNPALYGRQVIDYSARNERFIDTDENGNF